MDDTRDGTPVGAVRGSLYLPAGYVKANGATVQRADYPRLVALVERCGLWTEDAAANAGLFGRGDGTATMVLPDWRDRMAQLAGDGAGTTVAAGLPNIAGTMHFTEQTVSAGGAFQSATTYTPKTYHASGGGNNTTVNFSANRSNPIYGAAATVQPPAIKLIPIIRY